jgi:thioredoxin reductase
MPALIELWDAVIVGGSWAGLAAALQLTRARRHVLVIDAGQPRNRFARTAHGFLGQDGRPPAEIIKTFHTELRRYPTVLLRDGTATDARANDDGTFQVEFTWADPEFHQSVRTRRLILATGVVDELPNIAGLTERWGRQVLHCPYCHGYEVEEGRLGVLATGEASLHIALLLPDWSPKVTFFTNETFFPNAEQLSALEARGVRVEPRPVVALYGETASNLGVQVRGRGDAFWLDALFVASRTHLASPLAERLGCAIEEGPQGPMVRTDATKETSVKGVFCAGDAARTPHSATFAVADGAMAGIAVQRSLVMEDAEGERQGSVTTGKGKQKAESRKQ